MSDAEQAVVDGTMRQIKRKSAALRELYVLISPAHGLKDRDLDGVATYIAGWMRRCDEREDAARDNLEEAERLRLRCRALETFLGPERVKELMGE